MKNIKSINQLYEVLDAISISLDTNLTREQILGFYNVLKKVLLNSNSLSDSNDIIKIQKTYLNGSGGLIHDNVAGMKLYEFVPSTQSLNAITKAMKVNLELVKEEYDTSFSFSIDKKYEEKIIGSDLHGGVQSYTDSDTTTSDSSSKCGTNEELGADKVSCVCKNGYERKNGDCVKKEVKCEVDEELGADGVTCVKKNNSDTTKKVNMCILEGGYYYWYDSNGDKNPTKYKVGCKDEATSTNDNNSSTGENTSGGSTSSDNESTGSDGNKSDSSNENTGTEETKTDTE